MTEQRTTAAKDMKHAIVSSIRRSLTESGSSTKAELSDKLGLSFPTISKFLGLMEKEGEITLLGVDDSSGGRRAKRYAYNPEYRLGLAVFLEKDETVCAVFNSMGEIKEQRNHHSVLAYDVEALGALMGSLTQEFPGIRSLSIGLPAAVDHGTIIHIPGYESFDGMNLQRYLEDRFALPVAVENDMNAAVLGYYHRQGNPDHSSLVYLYFGQNGPGAGVMINGEVLRGSTFFSGEVSFVPLYNDQSFEQALYDKRASGQPREESVDAVSRLVASLTAILNPHQVVFCHDEVDEEMIRRIACESAAYVPERHLPELAMSDWREDYMYGLRYLGRELLITTDI